LTQLAGSVRTEWNALMPSLGHFLEYARLQSGEVFLTPALAGEGRSVTEGLPIPRFAIGAPATAEIGTFELLPEAMYALGNDLLKDNVARAQLREIGAERLCARVAVRGAATFIARTAPARLRARE